MNQSTPPNVVAMIDRERSHFDQAPAAFFLAWKYGVTIAGAECFGNGTPEGLERATSRWTLRPNLLTVTDAMDGMSRTQKVFLAAMVSFYDAREGGVLLRRIGIEGLADFGCLDLERRKVIGNLLLNYNDW